jgi:hypothetical protein
MLFVFLSHFTECYILPTGKTHLLSMLYGISKVASPTFMLVSGIVLGYLHETHAKDFEPVKRMLIGKGLFLLTIGRVLMTCAHIPIAGGLPQALNWFLITDAIGVCVILGSLTIQYMKPWHRMLAGLSIYCLSLLLVIFWVPQSRDLMGVKEVLVGPSAGAPYSDHVLADVFPLIPWFALYLTGTVVGSRFGRLYASGEVSRAVSYVGRLAIGCLVFGVAIAVVRKICWPMDQAELGVALSYQSHPEKLPPSIVYFLFYGGIGLSFLFGFLRFKNLAFVRSLANHVGVMGRVSLFVFIVQYYVYFSGLVLLRPGYSAFWPVYFVLSAMVIYLVSRLWFTSGMNRYLIIRYDKFLRPANR